MAEQQQRKNGVVPNPDPSAITTESIDRAISNLEEKVDVRIDAIQKAIEVFHSDLTRVPTLLDRSILGLRELLETRLVCMENDVKAVHAYLDTRGKDTSEQITHLRELAFSEISKVSDLTAERITGATSITNERIKSLSDVTTQQFKSIVDTFAEKDKAVSVGLSAQKESAAAQQASNTEATNKMESNFTKLLDQGRELLAEMRKNTDLQINDLKSGLGMITARLDRGEGKSSERDPAVTESLTRLMLKLDGLGKDMNGVHTMNATTAGHTKGKDDGLSLMGSIVLGIFAFAGVLGTIIMTVIAIKT